MKKTIFQKFAYQTFNTSYKNKMTKINTWMMMTYYCPTHGSLDRSEPIQISRNELRKAKLKSDKNKELLD